MCERQCLVMRVLAASPKAVDRRRSTTPCYHSQIRLWPGTQIHSRRPGGHITYTTSPQLYTSTAESTSRIPLSPDIPQPPSSPVSPHTTVPQSPHILRRSFPLQSSISRPSTPTTTTYHTCYTFLLYFPTTLHAVRARANRT